MFGQEPTETEQPDYKLALSQSQFFQIMEKSPSLYSYIGENQNVQVTSLNVDMSECTCISVNRMMKNLNF